MNKYQEFFNQVISKSPYDYYQHLKTKQQQKEVKIRSKLSGFIAVCVFSFLSYTNDFSFSLTDIFCMGLLSFASFAVAWMTLSFFPTAIYQFLPGFSQQTQEYLKAKESMIHSLSLPDFQHSFLIHLEVMIQEITLKTKKDTKIIKKKLKEDYQFFKTAFIEQRYDEAFVRLEEVIALMSSFNIDLIKKDKIKEFEQVHLSYKQNLEVPIESSSENNIEELEEKEMNSENDWKNRL